ncbi:cobaltochelatase subunit CobN [Stappia stellulata]|uniref:cobaltochelatase subunit CobN n=1 Tax=Stappia stellulata TaxID=71235 RepID=UPI001CD3A8FA|nr:cobaltochelatase subunit CobN [Stappia stellulata]MCA1241201.1 cobaltochelatase subunit CobN [Stappia stellulata]
MHILAGRSGRIDEGDEAVDLEQTPADVVFLSAADTELASLAGAVRRLGEAAPSVRLASLLALSHPYSVDLYAERTLQGSRLVILRLLGGAEYWPYGLERLGGLANGYGVKLAVMPGDDRWDAELAARSTLDIETVQRLWRYCADGGADNLANLLGFARHLLDGTPEPDPPRALPRAGLFQPGQAAASLADLKAQWRDPDAPVAAIVFYRALMQSAATEPVEALANALAARGLNPLPVFVASLKDAESAAVLASLFEEAAPAVVLNATAFAVSKAGVAHQPTPLDTPGAPVLQVIFSSSSQEGWQSADQGLSIRDLAMHVVLPEIDGRLTTRAVSFKEQGERDPLTQSAPVRFVPKADRIDFVAELAARMALLRTVPPAEKKLALILANYPNEDGRLANGVGLDTPASCVAVLKALEDAGYAVSGLPQDSAALMAAISSGPTNALEDRRARHGGAALALEDYAKHYERLPEAVRDAVTGRWGAPEADPHVEDGAFRLAITQFGNAVVGIQPARGYNIDPKETYHDPDLVPPHHYFAFYIWLREILGVHAVVHLGKHGNLEWLPGKALALSQDCFPEAVLGPVPNIYPFIVNDPGEGAQAKRRNSAVIVDHLTPPLTRAESHGVSQELEVLLDEYYLAQGVDPRRLKALTRDILETATRHGLDRDIGLTDEMDEETRLARLDAHLCDLKELQIRDGLHVLGAAPEGRLLTDLLSAMVRVPRGEGEANAGITRALARDLGLASASSRPSDARAGIGEPEDNEGPMAPRSRISADAPSGMTKDSDGFDPLDCAFEATWQGPRPDELARVSDAPWRSAGDTVERLELLAAGVIARGEAPEGWTATCAVLAEIEGRIAPAVIASGEGEMRGVLDALGGRFVPPGPSGAPTRGRPDVLPTGRNFYSVDVRAVPTQTSWKIGAASAERLVERHFQDEGEYPQAVVLTCWGTANMRTGGDDVAQALALIGTRPKWEPGSGRVTGFDILSLSELGRPRIDVTLRISGFFRDAFPHQIDLFQSAVAAVAALEEPADANPLADRVRAETQRLIAAGEPEDRAARTAAYRVFGSKPGAYGAGLQALIDEGVWSERSDFADAFLAWGGYAYGGGVQGDAARGALEERLSQVDAVLHNQDNREHDLLDSDDYYQFEGGLAATVETLKGAAPKIYHNDHSRPERPVIRTLSEEIGRVVRGRAANPKWIAGVMRHGYKGAFEIAATVDYLFAFAATTHAVGDHHFDQLYEAYLDDEAVRDFLAEANPKALEEIEARFREAVERGLWTPRRNSTRAALTTQQGETIG